MILSCLAHHRSDGVVKGPQPRLGMYFGDQIFVFNAELRSFACS